MHEYRLIFHPDETELYTELDDGRHHRCQAYLRSRRDASIVAVEHDPTHHAQLVASLPVPRSDANEVLCYHFIGPVVERNRRYRRAKDGGQIGANYTALAEALVKIRPLRRLAAVEAPACPHARIPLWNANDGNYVSGDAIPC